MSETPSYPALIELISRLKGKDRKICELALYCLNKADKRENYLRAENEKLRTATTELLSHYYDAMRRDGYADEEVRSEHVFLAAAAALKETGDE